ncbi:hypothetical protein KPH14_012731, partial [Odynerus spinipes]
SKTDTDKEQVVQAEDVIQPHQLGTMDKPLHSYARRPKITFAEVVKSSGGGSRCGDFVYIIREGSLGCTEGQFIRLGEHDIDWSGITAMRKELILTDTPSR